MFRSLFGFVPLLMKREVLSYPRSVSVPGSRSFTYLTRSTAGNLSDKLSVWNKLSSRDIVLFSKNRGKRKTVKAVAKRFTRTGSGALKYWRAGKNHKMIVKSGRARRNLRKPRYANRTQLKMLNKMLSGI